MGKRKGYNSISGTAKGCLPKNKGEEGRQLLIQMHGTQAPELSSLLWRYSKYFQVHCAVVKKKNNNKTDNKKTPK